MTAAPRAVGHYRMLGVDIDLRVGDEALARHLADVLAPFEVAGTGGQPLVIEPRDGGFTVTLDGAVIMRPTSREACLTHLVWRLNQGVIETPTPHLLIHASVAGRAGSALVFPGASGSGKTTLVAGLVRAGLDYLSDELAPIELATGLVTPFPRSLTLEQDVWSSFPELEERRAMVPGTDQWYVPPAELRGGRVEPRSLPVAAIVFPTARPGSPTTLSTLPRAEALVRLLRTTFNLADHGARGFRALEAIVRDASLCAELIGGSVDGAVSAVLDATSGLQPPAPAEHRAP